MVRDNSELEWVTVTICTWLTGVFVHLYNQQSADIISLQFIFSDRRLLIVERVSTCPHNRLSIPFELLARLLAWDYTSVGGTLT